jgi:hypothetical protein
MTDAKKEKWKKVGAKLKGVGADVIGGYLQGGFVGAGVEILGEFLKDKTGADISIDDPEAVEIELSKLTEDQLLDLKRFEAEKAVAAFAAEENLQDNVSARHESDNATDCDFVKRTRPGIAVAWTVVAVLQVLSGTFGWVPEKSESTYQMALWFTASVYGGIIIFYYGSRGLEKMSAILGNRFGSNPADKIRDIFKRRS